MSEAAILLQRAWVRKVAKGAFSGAYLASALTSISIGNNKLFMFLTPLHLPFSLLSPSLLSSPFFSLRADFAVTDWSTMIRCLLVQKRARPAYYAAPHKLSSCLNFALYLHGLHDGEEPDEDEEMVAERLEAIGVTSIEDAGPWEPVSSRELYDRALKLAPEQPIALFGKAILMLESAAYPRKKLWRQVSVCVCVEALLRRHRKSLPFLPSCFPFCLPS